MTVSLLDQMFFESILNIVQIFYVIVTMVIVYVYLKKAGSSFIMQPLSYLVSMTNKLLQLPLNPNVNITYFNHIDGNLKVPCRLERE